MLPSGLQSRPQTVCLPWPGLGKEIFGPSHGPLGNERMLLPPWPVNMYDVMGFKRLYLIILLGAVTGQWSYQVLVHRQIRFLQMITPSELPQTMQSSEQVDKRYGSFKSVVKLVMYNQEWMTY